MVTLVHKVTCMHLSTPPHTHTHNPQPKTTTRRHLSWPLQVRDRLENLSAALGLDFVTTARLVSKVRGNSSSSRRQQRSRRQQHGRGDNAAGTPKHYVVGVQGRRSALRRVTVSLCVLGLLPPTSMWFACAPQVPLLWNRSPEAAAAKLSSVAVALGVALPSAAALYMAVPALASINMPGVVRDRVDGLSDALGVTCAKVGGLRVEG